MQTVKAASGTSPGYVTDEFTLIFPKHFARTDKGARRAVDKLRDFGSSGHKSVTKQEGQIR
jgi:hypothetical protein